MFFYINTSKPNFPAVRVLNGACGVLGRALESQHDGLLTKQTLDSIIHIYPINIIEFKITKEAMHEESDCESTK